MSAGGCWRVEASDPDYPRSLTDLGRRAPGRICGVGDRDALATLEHGRTVTIVGSRRASAYGLRIAEQLGHDLAAAGVTVVSGMAWGIDSAAHRGAVAAAGTTLAVLAGGPDVIYPPSGARLYREIVASGAALSDRGPGVRPQRWSFTERNRIMAALAKLVIIVEAAEPSGSLVTAREALDLGREVGAVPGQAGMRTASGTNQLIADGAAMIRSVADALDRLGGVGVTAVGRSRPGLDPELGRVLELVGAGAASPDAIAAEGIDPHRAAIALTRLELLGYVRSNPAGRYSRTALSGPDD